MGGGHALECARCSRQQNAALWSGDIVPRHTFEYQRVHGFSSKVVMAFETANAPISTLSGGHVGIGGVGPAYM